MSPGAEPVSGESGPRGAFTFLHAADLHIDSPLRGLVAYEGAPAERLRLATREAFAGLVELAIAREVAFVILAGDLFDGEWPDFESGLWFAGQLRTLGSAGIRVFALRGNHDAASKVTKKLRWPDNVNEFSAKRPQTFDLPELGVALHGMSFAEAAVQTNLALDYPKARPNRLNIGVLHTAMEGREGHGRYAPCTLADLRAKDYDYWALGHVHQREVIAEDPWVVFPGNIQGRHVGELGPKGATLVHVSAGQVASLEPVVCDVARWDHLRLDVSDLRDEDGLLRLASEQLIDAVGRADGRLLAVRLTLHGSSALDSLLRLDEVRLGQELRLLAASVSEDLWLEKILIKTTPVADSLAPAEGLAALANNLRNAELDEEEFGRLTRELAQLADRLPAEVHEHWNPGDRSSLERALEPARLYLAALLSEADGSEA